MKKFLLVFAVALMTMFNSFAEGLFIYPQTEGFEQSNSIDLWSQQVISGASQWTVIEGLPYGNITSAFEGNLNLAYSSYNYNGDQAKIVTPQLNLNGITNPVLKFYHTQPVWSSDQDELRVYYRTSLTSEWFLLVEYTENIDYWREDVIVLPDPNDTYYLAFVAKSGYGYGVGIDNISIEQGSACVEPNVLSFINVKETSALLSWDSQSNVVYEMEYGPLGFSLESGIRISNILDNNIQLNDLASATDYSLYVRAYCSEGVSNWSGPYNFTTTCTIGQSIPYLDSFENNQNPLECWQVLYANYNTPAGNLVVVDNTVSFSGANSVRFSSYSVGSPYNQYLISPKLNLKETLEVSFKYRALSGSNEIFAVGFSTSETNPLSSITWSEDYINADDSWKEFKSAVTKDVKYIIIHYKSVFEYYMYIDDFRVGQPINCSIVENTNVSNIGLNQATLSWIDFPEATNVTLEYGLHGFTKGSGISVVPSMNSSYIIENLISNTTYDAYILTECEGFQYYSEVSTFTTLNNIVNPCPIVSSISADSISYTQASISWLTTGEESEWSIEYGIAGFSIGSGIQLDNLSTPTATLQSLQKNTEYDVYARAYCSDLGELSDWSESFSFRTLKDDVIDFPIEIGIEPIIILPTISISTSDVTNYICQDDTEAHFIPITIKNTGTFKIIAGTKIQYSIEYSSAHLLFFEEVTLPYDLEPNAEYSFYSTNGIVFIQEYNYVTAKLDANNFKIGQRTIMLTYVRVNQEITFINANDNTIESENLPVIINAEFASNVELDNTKITYNWSDGSNESHTVAYEEGVYTLTVVSEFCTTTKSVNVKKTLAGDGINSQLFDVYPNPSHGQITINTNTTSSPVSLSIYDSAGREVYRSVLSNSEQQIDLSSLASGIYNISLIENENVVIKRLFIE